MEKTQRRAQLFQVTPHCGNEGEGEEGVMTKRPIDKKGKLNIQCFSLKKEEKEENVIFNKREKKH